MDGLGQIAKAIITASQSVDQQAVQGQTKAIQSAAFRKPVAEDDAMIHMYNEYKRQMAIDGRRPLPIAQWKIINRNQR